MAEEWIKMRRDLARDPAVVQIRSALNADKLRTIGGLHALWSVFDAHSPDGRLPGYSFAIMDEEIGWPGFSQAVADAGWLKIEGNCLIAVNFESHNGKSAKRRAKEAARKTSARDADKTRTKSGPEEKRRDLSLSTRAPIPDDWQPSAETIAFAAIQSLPHSDLTLQKFKDHYAAEGKLTADPDASYRKWLANERRPGGTHAARGKTRFESDSQALDDYERQAERELRESASG